MGRSTFTLALSLFSVAIAVPFAQAAVNVPSIDVNVNGQVPGTSPVASVGKLDIFSGVTVHDPQTGMNQQTLRFLRLTDTPRMLITPLGPPLEAGTRNLTFLLNYNSVGSGGTNETELVDIRLVDSNLQNVLQIAIAGNNLNSLNVPPNNLGLIVGNAAPVNVPFSFGTTHAFQLNIDASARTFSFVLDATTSLATNTPWAASTTDINFIDITLATRAPAGGATSGEMHMDTILMEDPSSTLQEWSAGGDATNWTDAANWADGTVPTNGTVFIRDASTAEILSPAAGVTLDGLLLTLPTAGQKSLRLGGNFNTAGLNLAARGRVVVPAGQTLHVGNAFSVAGELRMEGGLMNGADFANGDGGLISGFGQINSKLTATAATSTIRGQAGQSLHFAQGSFSHLGSIDCNGGLIEFQTGVNLLASGNSMIALTGGTLVSHTNLQVTSTTARFDGPGTLEVGGAFGTALPAARMTLGGLTVELMADCTFEALTRDQGKNNHTLTGLSNTLGTLRVGGHKLTLRDDFHNDGSSAETALYVQNLDLTGTTMDVSGGRVYYQNLTGGSDTFDNFITMQNTAPNGVITSPASDVSVQVGQPVVFNGSSEDDAAGSTFLWTFGGSGINDSTAQNPAAIAFPTAGTFTVTLTVTDAESVVDPTPATRVITVTAVPTTPEPTDPTPTDPTTPTNPTTNTTPCGICGPFGPFFSMLCVGSYVGLLLRRRSKRTRR